jgi:hypothetical protein
VKAKITNSSHIMPNALPHLVFFFCLHEMCSMQCFPFVIWVFCVELVQCWNMWKGDGYLRVQVHQEG